MTGGEHSHDYDWLVIGSGFGGSVSALRLSEKGYSVGVLECGRRFDDHQFPKNTWDLRTYFSAPRLRIVGILRLSVFKVVLIPPPRPLAPTPLPHPHTPSIPPTSS